MARYLASLPPSMQCLATRVRATDRDKRNGILCRLPQSLWVKNYPFLTSRSYAKINPAREQISEQTDRRKEKASLCKKAGKRIDEQQSDSK